MEEENKETPSSPAKSEDSYTQCMSPTSEKKIESIAADDSAIKDVAIATTNENQESLVTKDEEETAVMLLGDPDNAVDVQVGCYRGQALPY